MYIPITWFCSPTLILLLFRRNGFNSTLLRLLITSALVCLSFAISLLFLHHSSKIVPIIQMTYFTLVLLAHLSRNSNSAYLGLFSCFLYSVYLDPSTYCPSVGTGFVHSMAHGRAIQKCKANYNQIQLSDNHVSIKLNRPAIQFMITTPEKKMRVRHHSSLPVHNKNDHVSSKQNPCDLTYNVHNP
jgi:hypothetical protein